MLFGVSPRNRRRLGALAVGLALVPTASVAGLTAAAALLTARPAAAQAPTVVSTIPVSLRTTPTYVAVEAYYNGSSFAGGGIIKVFVTERITFSDGTVR